MYVDNCKTNINLKDLLKYPFESNYIFKKRKAIKNKLLEENSKFIPVKIAVLGGSTTHDIINMIELFLLDYGIKPEFYESEYNQYYEEVMFNNDKLTAFNPDIIYLHTCNRNISGFPSIKDSSEVISEKLNCEFEKYLNIWQKIQTDYNCVIIQNNFEMPFYRLMGNKDCYDIHGRTNFIGQLNLRMYEFAQNNKNFYINDINYLSASYGLDKWIDVSAWFLYKYCCSIEAIPQLSFNIANIIKSIYGKNKKGLVLDLDNTLWGGVIGDDGVEGIEIGNETPISQAYAEFQEYIKNHKDLGVVLSINSKNNYESAICGLGHPENILNEEDFICIKANWQNKDSNIYEICSELNLLPENLVFVDDNPIERAMVKAQIQSISVPKIDNIENYIRIIDKSGFFELTELSDDDLARNQMYKENIQRIRQQKTFESYGDYLLSLEMAATINGFDNLYLSRIVQLINKSNQFNLTTKRYTQKEVEEIAKIKNYVCLCGKLKDKFGDNGVVSALIAKKDADILHIDLLVMSCRVLKRGMEETMMDCLVEEAKRCNISVVRGYYFKTNKNSMVKDFYAKFGFKLISENENNDTVWELNVEDYKNKNKVIKVEKNDS